MDTPEVIRGSVDGKKKYCRIPIRSKTAQTMIESCQTELDAEKILAMPHDLAVRTIDAIIDDWQYWYNRAGELFVRWAAYENMNDKGETQI